MKFNKDEATRLLSLLAGIYKPTNPERNLALAWFLISVIGTICPLNLLIREGTIRFLAVTGFEVVVFVTAAYCWSIAASRSYTISKNQVVFWSILSFCGWTINVDDILTLEVKGLHMLLTTPNRDRYVIYIGQDLRVKLKSLTVDLK